MVKTLPFADIQVPVPGFGAMGFSMGYGPASDEKDALVTLKKAVEIGSTFIDTAVVYGAGHNESLIGTLFKQNPSFREKVFVASKCGFNVDFETRAMKGVTNSPAHIKEYIEGTIARLGSAPDLYYLHRIDPSTDLEKSIPALDAVRKAGKCKYIGLSECSEKTLRKACSLVKIDALQIEFSPWFTNHVESGLIPAARELGVAIIAYSPIGKGILSGQYRSQADFPEGDIRRTIPRYSDENFPKNLAIVDEFRKLADKKGVTPSQLALAWVIAQGAIPIPGTRDAGRLVENFAATDVDLSPAELAVLNELIEEAKPHGNRYIQRGRSEDGWTLRASGQGRTDG